MKKIVLHNSVIHIKDILKMKHGNQGNLLIIAMKKGTVKGMVVSEPSGYILKVGLNRGAYGYSVTLGKCLIQGIEKFNYDFFVIGED